MDEKDELWVKYYPIIYDAAKFEAFITQHGEDIDEDNKMPIEEKKEEKLRSEIDNFEKERYMTEVAKTAERLRQDGVANLLQETTSKTELVESPKQRPEQKTEEIKEVKKEERKDNPFIRQGTESASTTYQIKLHCQNCRMEFTPKKIVWIFGCDHKFCKKCMRNYIMGLYHDNKKFTQVICPLCNEQISIQLIQNVCGNHIAEEFDRRGVQDVIE